MMRRSRLAVLAGIAHCLSILSARQVSAAEQDGRLSRSLRTDSPQLLALEVRQIGPNTVRAVVEYARDPRLGNQLTLNLANGPVTFTRLNDKQHGDRVGYRYEGGVRVTDEQIAEFNRRDARIRGLDDRAVHYEYDGRLLKGLTIAEPLSLFSLHPTQAMAGRLPVPTTSGVQAYLAVGALAPDPMSVLMITDRKVVGDCARTWDPCDPASRAQNGVWTFAHLMRSLPGVTDAAALTKSWLETWKTPQPFGPLSVEPRDIGTVLDEWPKVASTDTLDLDQAPLRLLAIVYRPDLADNLTFPALDSETPSAGSAGQLRFVFDVAPIVDSEFGKQCTVKDFQVIFEYRIAASTCLDVQHWVERWTGLAQLERGSDEYNQKLAEITEDIVVNHEGAFAQIRTNEIALDPGGPGTTKFWEMREFGLTGSGASLSLTERVVPQTPPDSLNKTEAFAQLINSKESDILNGTYDIPGNQGANPQMDESTFWRGDPAATEKIKNPLARFDFSLNTCNGCHARETCTKFSQVVPQGPGKEACLSAFLAGGHNVPDPLLCTDQECWKGAVCPESPTATIGTPVATATTTATPATPFVSTPGSTATATCHQLSTHTSTPITTPTASATPTLGTPVETATAVIWSPTPTPATAASTATPTATATATTTYNPCSYEPNDLQRRRQVLDQLTMCVFPNGYVRLNATH